MRQLIPPIVAASLVLAACGDAAAPDNADDGPESAVIVTSPDQPAPPGTTPPPVATTPVDDTTVPATAAPATTTTAPAPPPDVGDPSVSSERVTTVDGPVDLAVRPDDTALYLVEQGGRLIRHDPATDESSTVLDLGGRLSDGNEQGFLGVAFAPSGDLAYVNFTDRAGETVIAEFAVGPEGGFDSGSEREILRVVQPSSNHNAGDLEFGSDGMLYIPLGDGGSSGDPQRFASDPRSLLGSVLRIDPTPSGDRPYTIPPDNPFADGGEGAPEVWSWGLRNPWKIAFDPVTDDLWIADVGQNEFEEVNRVAPTGELGAGWGVNFGWSAFEGTAPFNADVSGEGTTPPVLTYGRDDGCSISGGVPYRGAAIPELEPAYVYSDFCGGRIWALDLAGGRVLTLLTGFDQVTAVRAGPDDELYVLEHSGGVHRLTAG